MVQNCNPTTTEHSKLQFLLLHKHIHGMLFCTKHTAASQQQVSSSKLHHHNIIPKGPSLEGRGWHQTVLLP